MGSSIRLALVLLAVALICHCSDNPTKPNRPPLLTPVGTLRVLEGAKLEFVLQATDPDGAVPTLTATNVPMNASAIDSGNGRMLFIFEPNFTQSGIYNVTFTASDGLRADSEVVKIMVIDALNHAPVLAAIGPKSETEGQTLAFNISASDSDGTIPTMTASNLPMHAAVADSGNGHMRFVFEPDFSQAGIHNVTFIASDGRLADSEVVTITVTDAGNHAPVLVPIGAKSVLEGQTLAFDVLASDPDGTFPALVVIDLPLHATVIDSGNGKLLFAFEPDFTQSGAYDVTFIASDGELSDSEIVTITVIEAGNQPPILAPIGLKSVSEGQSLTFTVSATDPEGSTPSMSAFNLPLNATATDSGNGRLLFAFNPDYTQSGVYTITFVASDGERADSESVTIEVLNTNRPPVLAHINDAEAYVDSTLSIIVSATDPDGTLPSLRVINAPENSAMTTSDGTARFVFTPDSSQIGAHEVTFLASDGELADSQTVTITVSVYVKSVGELLPMSVGNYWVYEVCDPCDSTYTRLDSIRVDSTYQKDGFTHWVLSSEIWLLGRDLAIRNDTIFNQGTAVVVPQLWPDHSETVPAGVFRPVWRYSLPRYYPYFTSEWVVFAKHVGVVAYLYVRISHVDEGEQRHAHLVRYRVK
jgi:PKD repeat protein